MTINREEQPVCEACEKAHKIMQLTRMPAEVIQRKEEYVASLREKARVLARTRLNNGEMPDDQHCQICGEVKEDVNEFEATDDVEYACISCVGKAIRGEVEGVEVNEGRPDIE